MLLDEATSALDIETETEVSNSIAFLKDITWLVIAHRFTAVAKVDKIAVLENGRQIQFDSYENLKQNTGRFQKLNNLQFDP